MKTETLLFAVGHQPEVGYSGWRIGALIAAASLFSACSSVEVSPTDGGVPATHANKVVVEKPELQASGKGRARREPSVASAKAGGAAAVEDDVKDAEPTIIRGSDSMINLPQVLPPVQVTAAGAVSLKFEQAPVTEVVHAILGDLLKVNYTIHQPLQGEITFHSQGPMAPEQVLPVLESVLAANGVMLVQDEQKIYHVGMPDALRALGNSPRKIGTLKAGNNIVIIPLKYIGAAEMADILKPVAPAEAFVRVDGLRNILLMAGNKGQISSWMEFVNIFDVDVLKGMSVGLFPLHHISVGEIEEALQAINSTGSAKTRRSDSAPNAGGANAQGGTGQTSTAHAAAALSEFPLIAPLGGVVKVIPIERMNAILVVTPRSYYLEQAQQWIEKLDRPRDSGNEPTLYVYAVQNGNAQHLASLLSAIFGSSQSGQSTSASSGVAPGLKASGSGRTSGSITDGVARSGSNASPQPTVANVAIGDGVRVVADEINNALLIFAPKRDYDKIVVALKRLDIQPTQVLIEASIVEVTLTDLTKFGLQWFLEGSLGGGWNGTAFVSATENSTPSASAPGFGYTVTNPAGAIRAAINAMATKSLVNVISNPSIMVQDNQTATIHVGNQQPIRSSSTVTDGGTTSTSISYKDAGVELEVTPSVNSGGMVSLALTQTVTDVGQVDAATGQRSFLQRKIATQVAVRNGETIVLGGLIRENVSDGKVGVPLLMDVPVLGNLFSSTEKNVDRTELLLLLTPRVMESDQDMREVGQEMREKMGSLSRVPMFDDAEHNRARAITN